MLNQQGVECAGGRIVESWFHPTRKDFRKRRRANRRASKVGWERERRRGGVGCDSPSLSRLLHAWVRDTKSNVVVIWRGKTVTRESKKEVELRWSENNAEGGRGV